MPSKNWKLICNESHDPILRLYLATAKVEEIEMLSRGWATLIVEDDSIPFLLRSDLIERRKDGNHERASRLELLCEEIQVPVFWFWSYPNAEALGYIPEHLKKRDINLAEETVPFEYCMNDFVVLQAFASGDWLTAILAEHFYEN